MSRLSARQDPNNHLDDERPMDEDECLDYADQEPLPFPTSTGELGPMAQFLSRFTLNCTGRWSRPRGGAQLRLEHARSRGEGQLECKIYSQLRWTRPLASGPWTCPLLRGACARRDAWRRLSGGSRGAAPWHLRAPRLGGSAAPSHAAAARCGAASAPAPVQRRIKGRGG